MDKDPGPSTERTRSLLLEYVQRLLRQTWLLATGGLGFLVTLVVEILFPNLLALFVYLGILGVGLIVGGYFVFVELIRESDAKISDLQSKLKTFESRQPLIEVGFQDDDHHLVKRVEFRVKPQPPKPDLDALTKAKREELLARKSAHRRRTSFHTKTALSLLQKPNPNYEEEVEQYLEEYRNYLMWQYECTIDRTRALLPVIKNEGRSPVNSVAIEFVMPEAYQRLPEYEHRIAPEDLEEMGFSPEEIEGFLQPREPELTINTMDLASRVVPAFAGRYAPFPAEAVAQVTSNTNGPLLEERDGVQYVTYTVEQLLQHRPEDDFEPFLVWLTDIDQSTVWAIPVRIYAAELGEPWEDTLYVDIVVTEDEKGDQAVE